VSERSTRAVGLGLVTVAYTALAWWFAFVCDDAYITFRYARNLARGYGIRYNPGEAPSEGYSNFLWLLLSAVCEALGIAPDWVNLVSAACGLALLGLVYAVARRRFGLGERASLGAVFALAVFPPFDVWATSGLETMSFSLAVFVAFERLALARDRSWAIGGGLALLAVGLSRTEGIFWGGVLLALGALVRWRQGERGVTRPFAIAAAVLLVPMLGYTAWRGWWFGSLVSNTALVKAHFGLGSLVRGLKYLAMYQLTFLAWLPLLAGLVPAVRREQAAGLAIAAMGVAFPLYGVLIGGDFMPMGRVFVAGLPFLYLLLAFALERLSVSTTLSVVSTVTMLGLLPGLGDVHLVPLPIREALHFRTTDREFLTELGRWENMKENTDGFLLRGRAIHDYASPDDTLVGQAVGAVGYASDLFMYDCYGLVTREVAELPVDPNAGWDHSPGHDKEVPAEYFVKYKPTYLHMRVVQGSKAAVLMKDSLDRWEVSDDVKDEYIPEFVELELEGETKRSFLMMVRRARPDDPPPDELWEGFEASRVALHRELKKTSADE
jgi:hypothetical protein